MARNTDRADASVRRARDRVVDMRAAGADGAEKAVRRRANDHDVVAYAARHGETLRRVAQRVAQDLVDASALSASRRGGGAPERVGTAGERVARAIGLDFSDVFQGESLARRAWPDAQSAPRGDGDTRRARTPTQDADALHMGGILAAGAVSDRAKSTRTAGDSIVVSPGAMDAHGLTVRQMLRGQRRADMRRPAMA